MSVYHCTLTVAGESAPVIGMHVIAATPKEARDYLATRFQSYSTEGLTDSMKQHIKSAQTTALLHGYETKATKSNVAPKNADNYIAD